MVDFADEFDAATAAAAAPLLCHVVIPLVVLKPFRRMLVLFLSVDVLHVDKASDLNGTDLQTVKA
jgi:hypothetical protein